MLMSIMSMIIPMILPTSMRMSVLSVDAAAPDCDVYSFYPDGLAVIPNYKLPTNDNVTCGIAGVYATGLSPWDPLCLTTQLAQILCCPAPTPLAHASPALAPDTAAKAGADPAQYEDLAWAALPADI